MNVFKNIFQQKTWSIGYFFLLLLGGLALSACREKSTTTVSPSMPELKSFVSKTDPAIGEEFSFTLSLEYPSAQEDLFLPDIGDQISGLRIVEPLYQKPQRRSSRVYTERAYRLVADVRGSYTLPAVELQLNWQNEELSLQTNRIFIEVGAGKTLSANLEGMGDILDIAALEYGEYPRSYVGYWFILGIILLLLLLYLIWKFSRDQLIEQPLSPYEWASLRIEEIERANWLEQGLKMEYCVAVSLVVRGYLKRAFSLPAEEFTLQEILPLLTGLQELSANDCSWLHDFLIESDRAKFAGIFPGRDRLQEGLAYFRGFVQRTSSPTEKAEEVQIASA